MIWLCHHTTHPCHSRDMVWHRPFCEEDNATLKQLHESLQELCHGGKGGDRWEVSADVALQIWHAFLWGTDGCKKSAMLWNGACDMTRYLVGSGERSYAVLGCNGVMKSWPLGYLQSSTMLPHFRQVDDWYSHSVNWTVDRIFHEFPLVPILVAKNRKVW